MKSRLALGAIVLSVSAVLPACESYVQSIDNPIESITDDQLNTQAQIPFLITGVQTQAAVAHKHASLLSGLLADELLFGGPGATFPQLVEIDEGKINVDNPIVDDFIVALGQMRFHADQLVTRVSTKIQFDSAGAPLKESALYHGYLYGGLARYWWGSYFGLAETQGGGVIDAGPFIPTTEMYAQAIEKYQQALTHAQDDYERHLVNSLIAQVYIAQNNYAAAAPFANGGLVNGDAPLESLYANTLTGGDDIWYYMGGIGRTQVIPDPRFSTYVADDTTEAERVLLQESPEDPATTIQARYPAQDSPIPVITWQENSLMLAEIALLGNQDAAGALGYINAVRASHGVNPLVQDVLNRDKLIEERDKELSFTGARLIDERRFNIWHLPSGTWQFLPITKKERDANQNF